MRMQAKSETLSDESTVKVLIDRNNAVLTKHQRQVLLRDKILSELTEEQRAGLDSEFNFNFRVDEMDEGTVRAHRSKARDRFLDSISDMGIAARYFHPEEFSNIRRLLEKERSELSETEVSEKELIIQGIYGMLEIAYELQDVGDMPEMEWMIMDIATGYHQRKVSHVIDGEHEHPFKVKVDIRDVPKDVDLVELVEISERDISALSDYEKEVLKYYLSEDERFRRMTEKQIGQGKVDILMDKD